MSRINSFFKTLRAEGLTNNEMCAGLGSGEIEQPEWMSISENTDHIKAWDSANGGSSQMGFVYIAYQDDSDE